MANNFWIDLPFVTSGGGGGGTGTVTSVGLIDASTGSIFGITGSPVTTSGNINISFPAPATSGNVLTSNGLTWLSSAPTGGGGGGSGTVTSVALSDTNPTNIFNITGSPVTTSGTLGLRFQSTSAGFVLSGPASSGGSPSFKAPTAYDWLSNAVNPDVSGLNVDMIAAYDTWTILKVTATSGARPYKITLPTPTIVGGKRQHVGIQIDLNSTQLVQLVAGSGTIGPLIPNSTSARTMWAGECAILETDGTDWFKVAGESIPMVCTMHNNTIKSFTSNSYTALPLDTVDIDNTGLMGTTAIQAITFRRSGNYVASGFNTYDPGNQPGGVWGANSGCATILVNNDIPSGVAFAITKGFIPTATGVDIIPTISYPIQGVSGNYISLVAYAGAASGQLMNGTTGCGLGVIEIPQW